MIGLQSFLQGVVKPGSSEDKFVDLSHLLCKTYGWDYYTLLEQPIPFIMDLLTSIKEQREREDKALKKKRR